ncbi:glycosyltransferase family 2 protein [Candidatus Nitrospira bockiana]
MNTETVYTGRSATEEQMVRRSGDRVDPQLSIIIANYNARELLRACLQSIYDNPPRASFEIYVVDDASNDGSAEMVQRHFPQVHLLRNDVNVKYGKSNNRALDVARGRYIYLLNNDTVMMPDALDQMKAFLDVHPTVGAVGNRLLNEDGSVQASVKTLPCAMSALFGARSVITKWFPHNPWTRRHLLHLGCDMKTPFPAGYVSSASIMIRREVVAQVGYLDERLMYHVDADYCKRIWDAGWEVYYLPEPTIVHLAHKGGTMVSVRRRFTALVEFHRGSYIFYQKHLMKSAWHPEHLVVLVGLGLRFVVSLVIQVSKECLPRRDRPSDALPV